MVQLEQLKEMASASAGSASALPYWAYTSQEVYEQESQKIFHRDWVFICNEFQIAKPGDRYAFILAGEPVVIIRGKDGELRAMSNSCRHRGTLLADEGFSSGGNNLVCPYHAWNYTEEGKLRGLPFPGNVKVDKEKHCLPRFALTVWHGLVFVNISGTAEPLEERYAALEPYIKHNQPEAFNSGYESEPEYWDTNWKLALENGIESYHLFKVHKPTLETITPTKGAYYLEGSALCSVSGGEVLDIMPKWTQWFSSSKEKNSNYILFSLPPSFVGAVSSDGLFGYISILPEGPGRTYVRGGGVGVDIKEPKGITKKFVDDFFAEDKFICERAFKGMTARAAPGGQLVELERIVVDFHQYLAMRLFNHQPDPAFKDEEGEKKLLAKA